MRQIPQLGHNNDAISGFTQTTAAYLSAQSRKPSIVTINECFEKVYMVPF